jgi:signal transduction histidine kinase
MEKDWLTRLDLLTRLRGARYARAASVTLLAAAAVGQAITQAVTLSGPGADGGQRPSFPGVLAAEYALPLSLLALLATVPLAVYRPAMAALTVTFGNAVALASFGQVTAGGLAAELIAACWLGLTGGLEGVRAFRGLGGHGSPGGHGNPGGAGGPGGPGAPVGPGITMGRYLAVGLGVPFLVIALAGGGRAAVLFASAVPVAGGIGIAVWSGRLAQTRSEAGEALSDTLLAHTARGERARIARELHDVVAHHISMIAVLSETGRLTTPGLPDAGARRFAEIGDTARAGLTEMRRLLGVLREDAASAAAWDAADSAPPRATAVGGARRVTAGRASRQPQPGLTQLTELIDTARDASVTGTRLIISGPVAPLDPGVELAAYRIVQEALTNARRHAPGAAVDVEVRYSPESLRLRVRDNGPGPAGVRGGSDHTGPGTAPDGAWPASAGGLPRAEDGGHGLLGMRERAFSVGGSLYTGMAPGGGFLVEAVLPTGQDPVPVPRAPVVTGESAGTGGLAAGSGR